jgi:hypothetical protein
MGEGNYLGLSSMVGRGKKSIFSFIKERLWKIFRIGAFWDLRWRMKFWEKRVGEAIYVKGQRRTVKIDATLHKKVAGIVTVI